MEEKKLSAKNKQKPSNQFLKHTEQNNSLFFLHFKHQTEKNDLKHFEAIEDKEKQKKNCVLK